MAVPAVPKQKYVFPKEAVPFGRKQAACEQPVAVPSTDLNLTISDSR
jgi:hypothetical protein